jgi:hypothetical protein
MVPKVMFGQSGQYLNALIEEHWSRSQPLPTLCGLVISMEPFILYLNLPICKMRGLIQYFHKHLSDSKYTHYYKVTCHFHYTIALN